MRCACDCRAMAPDTKVQQSAGTQKGRPKSGGKEKKAPALSPEQEQVRAVAASHNSSACSEIPSPSVR